MNEIFITNSSKKPALIVHYKGVLAIQSITDTGLTGKDLKDLNSLYAKKYPFKFRIYYFFDDQLDSILNTQNYFEKLFENSKFSKKLFLDGKTFPIPLPLMTPRKGQDGGVVN